MKLFVNHIDKEILEKKLKSVKHIDFSLFVEDIPKNQDDLSSINILLLLIKIIINNKIKYCQIQKSK